MYLNNKCRFKPFFINIYQKIVITLIVFVVPPTGSCRFSNRLLPTFPLRVGTFPIESRHLRTSKSAPLNLKVGTFLPAGDSLSPLDIYFRMPR